MNTPDTEWASKSVEIWEGKETPKEIAHAIITHFSDFISTKIKSDMESVIERLLTSRDTYWRERVEEAVKELLSYLPDATGRYAYAWEECDGEEQEMVKAIRAKYTPITNEDNLK